MSRHWVKLVAATWAVGFALVALLPGRWSARWVFVYWQLFGVLFLAAIVACAGLLMFRCRRGIRLRRSADSLFLAGWLAVELAAYFVITPFPAARRVIGIAIVGTILAGRLSSRIGRIRPMRKPQRWVIALAIAAGVVVAAIDTLDAFPEKDCAMRAAAITADRATGSRVWYVGHWGFQFYCERAGMCPVVPGESVLAPGDYLVLPIHPDSVGFHRPHFGREPIVMEPEWSEFVAELVWDDPLSAKTVPNYYGGINPIEGRDQPRLRVVVYRITRTWR
jgi:hypothetical protein